MGSERKFVTRHSTFAALYGIFMPESMGAKGDQGYRSPAQQ